MKLRLLSTKYCVWGFREIGIKGELRVFFGFREPFYMLLMDSEGCFMHFIEFCCVFMAVFVIVFVYCLGLFIVYCLLFVVCCLLFVVCCLLFVF